MPVMPSSVCTSTTMSSWFELVATSVYARVEQDVAGDAVIFMRALSRW